VTAEAAQNVAAGEGGRRPIGLLLVAPPVFLVGWMIIWPILSAVGRTLFLPDEEGGRRFTLETYTFFFSDSYSLGNLGVTLWTTGTCALLLLVICLPLRSTCALPAGA
jgi:ABC-type spermidine/putrescine transport system permease subunit I